MQGRSLVRALASEASIAALDVAKAMGDAPKQRDRLSADAVEQKLVEAQRRIEGALATWREMPA